MTNREFDNYLTLLASLLQVRGEQREAIARELQAHLEDRLDDLLARGIDRDEAVQLALAEFGDAAGLAANFSLLVRNRRRRWIVKVTSFSTAALVLLAIWIIALWPEHRPGPAPQPVIAQQPAEAPPAIGAPPAADPDGPVKVNGSGSRLAVAPSAGVLDDKLAQRVTAEFVETPLQDVLQFLSDQADVQMFVNRKALEDEGLESDTPITISLKRVRLDMLLDLILEQAGSGGLTYVERDGILIISTLTNLEGASEVRVYNCRDLLAMEGPKPEKPRAGGMPGGVPAAVPGDGGGAPMQGGFGGGMAISGGGFGGGLGGGEGERVPLTEAERRAESLKGLICTAVKPDSWSEVGGLGTISEYNGLIVINHTSKVHKKVEEVLKMLREAAGLDLRKPAN